MNRKNTLALLLTSFVSLGALSAQAQDEIAPTGVPSDAEGAKAVVPSSAAPVAEEGLVMPRFRWGIAPSGGPMYGTARGGAGALNLRFGVQLSELLGVYTQPVLMVGAGARSDDKSASVTGMALYGIGVMAEVDLIDMIYLAAGPELTWGGVGTATRKANETSASGGTGPFFSIAARAGLALGSTNKQRRSAFTIGLEMQTVFYGGGTAVVPMLALGYDRF